MDAALTVLTGILVAVATAYATSRFYVHQATADLRTEFQKRFNEKKWDAYTGFAATVKQVFVSAKENRSQRDQPKQVAQLFDFISDLWLIGSDDVVRKVVEWRRTPQEDAKDILWKLAEILIAMRKDLGDTETQITPRDLLATFINDIDTAFPR